MVSIKDIFVGQLPFAKNYARRGKIWRLVWHRVRYQGNRTVVDRKDRCLKDNDAEIKET